MWGITLCHAVTSSLHYKAIITSYRSSLDLINRLQPIAFRSNADGTANSGLGAETVAPLLVSHNDCGEVEDFKYDRVAVVLINAINRQPTQIQPRKRVRRSRHS
jgi:hypothetical protein